MSSFRHSSAARRSTPSATSFDTFSEFGQDGGNEFGDNAFGSNENEQNEGNRQRQHSKEFREKYDKQKKELFDAQELSLLLEAKKNTLLEKLKQQKLMAECNKLEAKVLNQQNQADQKIRQWKMSSSDHPQNDQQQMTELLAKIGALEMNTNERFGKIFEKISLLEILFESASSDHSQNDQHQMMELLAKIGEMKTETNEKFEKIFEKISVLDNLKQQNYWDAGKCHNKFTICGHKNLAVHHNRNGNCICSVFGKSFVC